MTSYRDLAEADAFERRRLATTLVSGIRAGPAAEPTRTARQVMGGLVLTAVLVAVPAASHALTGHPAFGWDHGRARISR
ncbi:hypothetical protein [Nocardioides sp.]|uniref:hypothetical protein n=1 Tax=Nocardioides sp. TaxID=35761 RepID=UPI002F41C068